VILKDTSKFRRGKGASYGTDGLESSVAWSEDGDISQTLNGGDELCACEGSDEGGEVCSYCGSTDKLGYGEDLIDYVDCSTSEIDVLRMVNLSVMMIEKWTYRYGNTGFLDKTAIDGNIGTVADSFNTLTSSDIGKGRVR
jgi:hypothetical protein